MSSEYVLKIAMLAGEIMLTNGAETYRVEDTMERIMNNYDCELADSFVITTGLMASISDKNSQVFTMVRRVKTRSTNLEKVALVNQFSRDICTNKTNPMEAYLQLKEINTRLPYPNYLKILASTIACYAFGFMFGGGNVEALTSSLVGFISYVLLIFISKGNLSRVIIHLFIGFIIGAASTGLEILNIAHFDKDIVIIASMMPYVPGLLLTNAVRDVMEGDFLSGTARIFDAIIISISLAAGVGFAIKGISLLLGGPSI